MKEIPNELQTKQDWHIAADFAAESGDAAAKSALASRIRAMAAVRTKKVLKEGATPHYEPWDEGHAMPQYWPSDYEDVADAAATFNRLGFTDGEISQMLAKLGGAT